QQGPRAAVLVQTRRRHGYQGLGRRRGRHEDRRQAQAHDPAGPGLRRPRRRRRHPAEGHAGPRGGAAQGQEMTRNGGAAPAAPLPRRSGPTYLAFWNCLMRSSPPGILATRASSSANDLNVVSISPLYFFCSASSSSLLGLGSFSIRFLMSPIWSLNLATFGW